MLKQNIPPQLLTEAKKIDSVVKNTLDSLGMHLYSTLTWGAAIGAFIGPAKATLANQATQVTPENYVLLATALAAATFHKMVSKEHQQEINDKLKERGLVGAFENVADDEVGTIKKVIDWLANAMGKGVDEILGIASFTAFFTPIVEYIASTTGVIDVPDPMAALKLIMTSVGVEALRSFIKYVKSKDRETVQSLKDIDSTLARAEKARGEKETMDTRTLKEMIEEVTSGKSMLLERPTGDHETEIQDGSSEGRMAKSQLYNIMGNARYLHDFLSDDADLPEWVESKITKASDYLTSAKDHLSYEYSGPGKEIDQHQMMTKDEALSMVDGIARRVECPITKKALTTVVDKLRQHVGDDMGEEEMVS